jgi:hypothetical protein
MTPLEIGQRAGFQRPHRAGIYTDRTLASSKEVQAHVALTHLPGIGVILGGAIWAGFGAGTATDALCAIHQYNSVLRPFENCLHWANLLAGWIRAVVA